MTRQHRLLVSVGLAHLIERPHGANRHRMKHGVVCFSDAGVYRDRPRRGGADSGCCPCHILQTSQQEQKQKTILWYDAKTIFAKYTFGTPLADTGVEYTRFIYLKGEISDLQ